MNLFWSIVMLALTGPSGEPSWEEGHRTLVHQERILSEAEVHGHPKPIGGGAMLKYVVYLAAESTPKLKTIFKPAQTGIGGSPLGEVAGYRLAKLLRIPRVPTTVLRTLPFSEFSCSGKPCSERLGCDDKQLQACKESGITGSLQVWMTFPGNVFRSTDRRWFEKVLRGLKPGRELENPVEAGDVSDLVVFDYLLSNPDRFTGGNLLRDAQERLWYIDNSAAFTGCVQPDRDFERLHRFRTTTVLALRSITPALLLAQMAGLASEKPLSAMVKRLEYVRARIDALVKEHGEAAILLP